MTSPRGAPCQRAESRHQCGDTERQPHEPPAQLIETTFQRCASFLDRADERTDTSDLGRPAGFGDDGNRRSFRHGRPLVDHVRTVGERRSFLELFLGAFRNRKRLARERGFVRSKIRRLDQTRIRRHQPADVELHDVARNDRRRVDHPKLPRSDDRRLRDVELQKRLHGAARPKLGDETDERC